jgi:hypothetical protein
MSCGFDPRPRHQVLGNFDSNTHLLDDTLPGRGTQSGPPLGSGPSMNSTAAMCRFALPPHRA